MTENNKYKYKFSVIIPIYNVEKYLEETILSVVNQDIGFEKNIQIILVNDGSKDNSEKICLKYKQMYPNNIIYVKQENLGVSSARNLGMQYIEGKYTNFLDADDIWDTDAFKIAWEFLEKNNDKIDFVACRMKFFEAREGYHKLDFKFEENSIVNILDKYDYIQLTNSATFSKSNVIKNYNYDEKLKYFEDATLISKMLISNPQYGILKDAVYNLRKREKADSTTQIQKYAKDYYTYTIEKAHKEIFKNCIKKYKKIIPYFQYLIMYDIGWRLNVDISKYIDNKTKTIYIKHIIELLKQIDDRIILKQKFMKKEYKILALCLKYEKDIREDFIYQDPTMCFNEYKLFDINNKSLLKIMNIKVSKKKIILYARINCYLKEEDYKIFVKNSNEDRYYAQKYKILKNRPSIIGNLNNYKTIQIKIPISKDYDDKLKIFIEYKSSEKDLNIIFCDDCDLYEKTKKIYLKSNCKLKFKEKEIKIEKLTEQEIEKQIKKEKDKKRKEREKRKKKGF